MVGTVSVVYLLVAAAPTVMPDGASPCATNMVWNRILWDGVTPYSPPSGMRLAADDGSAIGAVTLAAAIAVKS